MKDITVKLKLNHSPSQEWKDVCEELFNVKELLYELRDSANYVKTVQTIDSAIVEIDKGIEEVVEQILKIDLELMKEDV